MEAPTISAKPKFVLTLILIGSLLMAGTASAHPVGVCVDEESQRQTDRCEAWSVVYDDPSIQAPHRSDQFPTSVAMSDSTVFTTVKNVALDPNDPYEATSEWLVLAHDRATGEAVWTAARNSRPYDSPLAVAVSPDGSVVYVTGAAYDAFSVAATDSRVVTVAYDATTGEELWSQTWDGRPDGTDVGKTITVSDDGRVVLVGGVTSKARGDLDFLTIAYDTRRGREMWTTTVSGPPGRVTDSLEAIAISPDSKFAYVTGKSGGEAEFDADFLTIAYRLQSGREVWRARYDGLGEHKSDRPNGLAVAPDGSRVYVTGDSWGGTRDGRTQYDYATVAYDADGGTELWTGRYGGPVAGFNSAIGVVATETRVVVTGQSRGASSDDVRDFGTVGYDADTGEEQWRHRYAPAHHDDIALHLALGDDVAYVTGSSSPTVPHTNLDETAVVAYRVDDGGIEWQSRLDLKPDDALAPRAIAAGARGGVVIAAQVTRSADLIEGPTSNVYDALIVSY